MKQVETLAADRSEARHPARTYRMVARSEAAARTHRRIVDSAFELYSQRDFDQVSLEDVAAYAGVTVRTVLRRFGTKERLLEAVAEAGNQAVDDRRREVTPGDTRAAVRCVVADYERYGDAIMRLLSQEERVPAFRPIADHGRELHYDWVERTFAPELSRRRGSARRRLLAALVAITDVYTWKLLRRDLGLGREAVIQTLGEMVAGVSGRELAGTSR